MQYFRLAAYLLDGLSFSNASYTADAPSKSPEASRHMPNNFLYRALSLGTDDVDAPACIASKQDSANEICPTSKAATHTCSRAARRSASPNALDDEEDEDVPLSVRPRRSLPWVTTRFGSRILWARM